MYDPNMVHQIASIPPAFSSACCSDAREKNIGGFVSPTPSGVDSGDLTTSRTIGGCGANAEELG